MVVLFSFALLFFSNKQLLFVSLFYYVAFFDYLLEYVFNIKPFDIKLISIVFFVLCLIVLAVNKYYIPIDIDVKPCLLTTFGFILISIYNSKLHSKTKSKAS